MFSSKLSECIICFCTLKCEPCKDPEYFTGVFDAFCHLLEIKIESMQWNFEQDVVPFCHVCYSAVEKLKELYDQLNLIQKEISNILQLTKQNILTSGCTPTISNERNEIDRVAYIRQQAVKGIHLVQNPVIIDEITGNNKEDTDLLFKVEIYEEGIIEEPVFQEQIDVNDPLDGANNGNYIETVCITDEDLISGDVIVDSDSLLLSQSEANEESVESSGNRSDVIISDPDESNKCRFCEKTFQRKSSLKLHLEEEHECDFCDGIFESRKTLKLHRKEIHNNGEKAFKCDVCHKSVYSANDLQHHTALHSRKRSLKFDPCEKCIAHLKHLNQHRKNDIVKPHKCDTCDKCFPSPSHLISHQRFHTGERPFKCEACGKYFKHKNQLTDHVRIHTGEKPYKCDSCDKCFKSKAHLTSHQRTHTGEKPFKCDTCGQCFTERRNLKKHIMNHTVEKPYKCERCYKSFGRNSQLIIHTRHHMGEKS